MGNHDVELFEVAHVYLPVAGSKVPSERWRLGGILQGNFFRAKGIVEAVFEALQVEPVFERAQVLAGSPVGARGAVRVGRAARAGRRSTASGARSSSTSRSCSSSCPERILYRDVITFPPLRQDLAFVVDENVPAGELLAAAREAAGEELREVRFLSDYRGDQIPAGKKSVAFAVVVPVARAHAVGRGCGEAPRRGRRGARDPLRRRAARLIPRRPRAGRAAPTRFNRGQTPAMSEGGHGSRDKSVELGASRRMSDRRPRRYRRSQWHANHVSKLPTSCTTSVRAASRSVQIFDCARPTTVSTFLELLAKSSESSAGRFTPTA